MVSTIKIGTQISWT